MEDKNSELERKLLALTDANRGLILSNEEHKLSLLRAAACIGAEIEREACIDVVATSGDQFASVTHQAEVQARIRVRGGK